MHDVPRGAFEMSVTVSRTHDPDLVTGIMLQPEIWRTCAEDGRDYGDFVPNMDEYWLTVTNYNQIAGLYNLHAINSATLQIHVAILPEFRQECGKESARGMLKWVLDYTPVKYQKILAFIPEIYPNVVAFAENAGFQHEGVNRKSAWEDGKLVDQIMLGITRQEMEEFLRQRQ